MDLSLATTKWLALGLLRSTEVMGLTLSRLDINDFNDSEMPLKIVYQISHRWYQSNKRDPVPKEVAVSVLADEVVPNRVLPDSATLELGNLLHWVYEEVSEVDSYKNFLLENLNKFILDRKVRPAAMGLDRQANIVESLQELNKTVARNSISKAKITDPFASSNPILNSDKRIPWGVDWVDMVTNGGAQKGETTLLLAPSGGGKTLTNIQLATTSALQGEEAVIVTYEQGLLGIVNRIYAFAMGIPLNAFNGLNQTEFSGNKTMKAKYDEVRSRLEGKIKIIDQVDASQASIGGGCGGAAEVAQLIKQIQDDGGRPRYVGIDWLGPLVNNYMAARNLSSGDMTKIMGEVADELRKVGTNYGVNIWIYHQLGTQAAQAGASRKPEWTDAYMCRTLAHWMDTVICIGNRDKESNIAWVNAPKVRNGLPFSDTMIRMEGAMSRWKLVDRSTVNVQTMKPFLMDDGSESEAVSAPARKLVKAADFNDSVRAHLG